MPGASKRRFQLSKELELERIITLREAHEISGLSPDAWRDNHRDKIIQLSPRRQGIKLKHVLNVGQPAAWIPPAPMPGPAAPSKKTETSQTSLARVFSRDGRALPDGRISPQRAARRRRFATQGVPRGRAIPRGAEAVVPSPGWLVDTESPQRGV